MLDRTLRTLLLLFGFGFTGACVDETDASMEASSGDHDVRGELGKADEIRGSCEASSNACGGRSNGNCWCDEICVEYGDCCEDIVSVCGFDRCDPEDDKCPNPLTCQLDARSERYDCSEAACDPITGCDKPFPDVFPLDIPFGSGVPRELTLGYQGDLFVSKGDSIYRVSRRDGSLSLFASNVLGPAGIADTQYIYDMTYDPIRNRMYIAGARNTPPNGRRVGELSEVGPTAGVRVLIDSSTMADGEPALYSVPGTVTSSPRVPFGGYLYFQQRYLGDDRAQIWRFDPDRPNDTIERFDTRGQGANADALLVLGNALAMVYEPGGLEALDPRGATSRQLRDDIESRRIGTVAQGVAISRQRTRNDVIDIAVDERYLDLFETRSDGRVWHIDLD